MNDSNAQLFLMAQAEMVRAAGMTAENKRREMTGEYGVYDMDDFERSACQIEKFAQQFTFDG